MTNITPMSVFITTFNMNMRSSKLSDHELRAWLAPAFKSEGKEPELLAIGIQELLPLELALSGWTISSLRTLESRILIALSSLTSETTYTPIASNHQGGVGLIVLGSESLTSGRISKPSLACVSLGDAGLANKAAVGVRVAVNRSESGQEAWESFTFISAHLAAHDYNLSKRNGEFTTILTSLLFTPSAVLTLPQRIFDSSHTFFMGDLNYRLSRLPSKGHLLYQQVLSEDEEIVKEREELLLLDTLKAEQSKGRTMTGLQEGDLKTFAPTYKRLVGQVDGYSPKRIPGYTDRILFASCSRSGENNSISMEDEQMEVLIYNSINEITLSDHKPVYSILSLPPSSCSGGSSPHNTPQLPLTSLPPRQDKAVLVLWKIWGFTIDRVAGYAWLLTLVMGGGKLFIGLAVESVLLIGLLAYWSGYLRI